MSRVSIRVRLTAIFALAMVVVLAGAGGFVYQRVRAGLDETINEGLRARADAAVRLAREPRASLRQSGARFFGEELAEHREESFTQILAADGRVLDHSENVGRAVLSPSEVRRAQTDTLLVDTHVAGIEGNVRLRGQAASGKRSSPVVVVGQSIDDRHDTLSNLVAAFAVGGPIAVVVASIVGYVLAAVGLAPIEAMRRRAAEVSLESGDELLPLPAARDEVRRLGETLNQMLERLRRSFERERRFVADASHELRTPVAVVKTEIEAALRSGDYGPRAREALVAALEECDSLAQLAEDLLVIVRAAEGQLPVREEQLGLRSALEAVRERFADRAAERGRHIRVDAPDGLLVQADPLRLRQALGNLIDNALRHGEGDVALRARRAEDGIEIEVADQGTGFAPALGDGAFERFTRGDQARTRGGAGLGMAIVRAIAEAHGGRTAIAPGPGGVVHIWLPGPPG